ncbi:MAG: hypothetical protein Kow0040_32330 [Thermogutta sp.]
MRGSFGEAELHDDEYRNAVNAIPLTMLGDKVVIARAVDLSRKTGRRVFHGTLGLSLPTEDRQAAY